MSERITIYHNFLPLADSKLWNRFLQQMDKLVMTPVWQQKIPQLGVPKQLIFFTAVHAVSVPSLQLEREP
jgi:hypothetical protein